MKFCQAVQKSRLLIAVVLFSISLLGAAHAQNDYVWIESQNTSARNVEANDKRKFEVGGWGNSHFLSEGNWLQVNVGEGDVEAQVPESGIVLSYKFSAPKTANYEIWNRIGFEFVRSPFDWRVDGGAWKNVSPQDFTTDLMNIATWTEIAWFKMGSAQLNAGEHTLEIRIRRTKDKDKWQRILYASDALLISASPFAPNGPNKPGQNFAQFKDSERAKAQADADAAAKKVFDVPSADAAQRAEVKLDGLWQIARDDEQEPREVATPIQALPSNPIWTAIAVPSDKNKSRPDLQFAHRLWYRTRVNVPQNQIGRSFFVHFPMNNLNTTVYVNGVLCGFNKNPYAPFQIDVTKAIKAGANEIYVGIRDAWYGFTANSDNPRKLRQTFNLPIDFFGRGFQDLAYPIWNNPNSGILETPSFVVAGGPVYAADVFPKPRVGEKKLEAEITLQNTSNAPVSGQIQWAAINDKTGAVEKAFTPQSFTVAANNVSTHNVADVWTNARLWWPNDPQMYRLRTTITVNNQPVDVREIPFGFREWTMRGVDFVLNGVRWPMWADLAPLAAQTPAEFLKIYRDTNQRTFRLMMPGQGAGQTRFLGMPLSEFLEFCDRNGVVVRRNGMLDGQVIGYAFSEGDAAMKARNGGSEMKVDLMNNWRDQMVQQVRGERNHTSIQIWTTENEFAYINLINLLGNSPLMDEYEAAITRVSQAVSLADPTRPNMIDGGGATKANTLPVHGDHYVFSPSNMRYPDLAYEAYPEGGGRGRWRWDQKRPRFLGEDYFAAGIRPQDYAQWMGEEAFLGKNQSKPAMAFIYRMLTEGYRWGGLYGAWHFWLGNETPEQFKSNDWRAAFVRQYDWTFAGGQSIKRTYGVFNDTQFAEPIAFTRTLLLNGKTVFNKASTHNIAPGGNWKFDETLPLPAVTSRQNAQLVLKLVAGGKEIYRDTKTISLLPPVRVTFGATATTTKPTTKPTPARRTQLQIETHSSAQVSASANRLLVFDPKGDVVKFLTAQKTPFTPINSLENIPPGRVLIIGRDALDAAQSTSSALAAWASGGKTVIVLEQNNPLKYQGLPADMDVAPTTSRNDFGQEVPTSSGPIAFPEDLSHPVFRGLGARDLIAWNNRAVFKMAYLKPRRGARSLAQAGPMLGQSVLSEVPAGNGILILSQLQIGQNLASNVVAQRLLANMISYASTYKREVRPTVAVIAAGSPLAKVLDASGLKYSKANNVLAAIAAPNKLAIIEATPANLQTLAANKARVDAFTSGGGYIVLNGLTPEGLADYNKLVGYNHLIRPYGGTPTQTSIAGAKSLERITFSSPRNPLTAGLTNSDITMFSGQRIFGWISDEWLADDVFSYIVDLDEIAPFGKSPFGAYGNITNGLTNAEGWPHIINMELPKDAQGNYQPYEIPITLPREETITEFTWVGNNNYWPTMQVKLLFDGGATQTFDVQPTTEPQTFAVSPPRKTKNIMLAITGWQPKQGSNALVGIDNIHFKVARPNNFHQLVKPMLNVGAIVQYPRGKGGIVLNNVLFKNSEAVPANEIKKRSVFSTILANLNAPFAGTTAVFAGSNLDYTPIDIGKFATQFRNERGWFGDANFTFAGLPTGRQTFNGVTYNIFDFATSPVPTAIMLAGNGVPNGVTAQEVKGIPVGRKADALFFLHTARMDARRSEQERRENKKYEMARYTVNYADGQSVTVPIYAEIDIDDFKQKTPQALPGASIAWTRPYAGTEYSAVAYTRQWNNPRPDVEIKSVDFGYGPDRRGVPVLLAISAAKVAK